MTRVGVRVGSGDLIPPCLPVLGGRRLFGLTRWYGALLRYFSIEASCFAQVVWTLSIGLD